MLVGRLCAVLSRDDAVRLLAAYLDEVLDQVAKEERSVQAPARFRPLKTEIVLRYPPMPVDGGA